MRVLIIIPAYNEEKNLEKVIADVTQYCPQYDYMIVNDASSDRTADLCKHKGYRFLDQPINLGIGGTVQNGYQYALEHGYDVAVQIDGDGQHDVRYLPEMVRIIENKESEIVVGSRFIDRQGFQSSGLRRAGIRILSICIFLLTGKMIKDVTSGFRVVNRHFIEIYSKDYPQDYPEPEALVTAVMHGGNIKEHPVVMRERVSGTSSINLRKSIYYMVKVVIALLICRISYGVRRGNKEHS